MKHSVQLEEFKSTKLVKLLQVLWTKITAAVTTIQKSESRKQYEKKMCLATIAPGSVFSILIIVLLLLNGWLVANSGDNFYDSQLALGFLAIANIVFLAVSARSNASAVVAQNDRPSSPPNAGDRFFSLSLDLLCVLSFDGYVTLINPAAEKILGYSPGEMIGQLFLEFVHPDDREATLKEAESLAAGNNTVGFENRWRCRNGSYKWIAWTGSRFWEEELMYGVGRDITAQKQAEAALQESQHFVERIANTSPNLLFVYDESEQRNVYSNREISDILGYTAEEVENMGSNLLPTIIHPDDLAKFPGYFQQLENAPDGEVIEYEYRVRDKHNCWHWLVSRNIVFSRTEEGKIKQRLGAATDITERKIAEQALAEQLKLSLFTADVGIVLTQNQGLRTTLQYCADAVVRHLDVAFARIWTLNEDGNVLQLQASAGIYTHIDGAHSRIAVGEFKIGLIALERQPHITNCVKEDPRIQDKKWASREGMVAFAGYPLIVDNQLLGVIAMFARQELNESMLIALASSADTIALGIKRKQTEEALARQQQTLRAIIDNAPIWV
ncbi:PAS domain S-box protein [Microcoleus sp. Pol12A5]